MHLSPTSRTNGRTLLEPSLADRSSGEESMEQIVVGVHMTDNQLRPQMLGS